MLAQSYRQVGRYDLEKEVMGRVTKLDKDQLVLLNPRWLSAVYLKTGNREMAASIMREGLQLDPREASLQSALAEIYLFDGNLDEAGRLSKELQARLETRYQIVGRIIHGFALQMASKQAEAAKEFSWVASFLISAGAVPPTMWDYRDLQSLVHLLGANARSATVLLNVLNGSISLQEFVQSWNELFPTRESDVTVPR
jgi:tetratricopeptide (TPR) repeat protein